MKSFLNLGQPYCKYMTEDYNRADLTETATCHSTNQVWTQADRPLDGPVLFGDQFRMMAPPCKEGTIADTMTRTGQKLHSSLPLYTFFKAGFFWVYKYYNPVISHPVEIGIQVSK